MPSIFTRIVNGEIPSVKVYEDDHTLAFMDINPAARGHVLVICKAEHPDIWSIPPELLSAVALATQKIALALRASLKPDGINIIQNNGAASGQEVFHYHVHMIPRWEGDHALRLWKPQPSDQADLQVVAEHIRQALTHP